MLKKIIFYYGLSGVALLNTFATYQRPDHVAILFFLIAVLSANNGERLVEMTGGYTRTTLILIVYSLLLGASVGFIARAIGKNTWYVLIGCAVTATCCLLLFLAKKPENITRHKYVCVKEGIDGTKIIVGGHLDSYDKRVETIRRIESEIVADCPLIYRSRTYYSNPIAYTIGEGRHNGKILVWYEFSCAPQAVASAIRHFSKRGYQEYGSLPEQLT